MERSRPKEEGHNNSERWLLTYADLITLLMAFFIIMYAMSNVDNQKYMALAKSLRMALGLEQAAGISMITDMVSVDKAGKSKDIYLNEQGRQVTASEILSMRDEKEEREFSVMVKKIAEYTESKGITSKIQTEKGNRGLLIKLSDTVLFDVGKADLSPKSKEILDGLADILFDSNKHIKVEGHTDNVPINTARYPSNWHLSTDRSTNVIIYWISKYPDISQRLSAAGYGEYRPVASNSAPEGRAKNRRVEIIVLRDIVNQVESGQGYIAPADHGEKLPTDQKTENRNQRSE